MVALRFVAVIALLLLGGAVLNVAVAWTCAMCVAPMGSHVVETKGWSAPSPRRAVR